MHRTILRRTQTEETEGCQGGTSWQDSLRGHFEPTGVTCGNQQRLIKTPALKKNNNNKNQNLYIFEAVHSQGAYNPQSMGLKPIDLETS